jgi:hypothetical protein
VEELGALPLAKWLHVVLDTSRTSATLIVDGASLTLPVSVPAGTGRALHVGVTQAVAGTLSGGVFVDNVECTLATN